MVRKGKGNAHPYLLTTLLYSFIALFVAADASLVSVNLIGAFPALRWDIWLTLNVGLVALVAGFSGVNQPMIFAGGTRSFLRLRGMD